MDIRQIVTDHFAIHGYSIGKDELVAKLEAAWASRCDALKETPRLYIECPVCDTNAYRCDRCGGLGFVSYEPPASVQAAPKPVSEAPRDGNDHAFDISFKARAFWCDDLKCWVLVRPLHMERLPEHAKYLGPARFKPDDQGR